MLRLMKPKFFMPIHGEYRMLKLHTELAEQTHIPQKNSFILENGDVLALTRDSARVAGHFFAGDVYVDGSGIGDIGNVVLHDRHVLSEEGIVIVVATLNLKKKQVLAGPDILSRGFVYMRESGELINKGQKRAYHMIRNVFKNEDKVTEGKIREAIIDELQEFLFAKTERHPMILPMLVTV